MDIITFLALALAGLLAFTLVLSSIIWCAVKLWQRLTGNRLSPAAFEAGLNHRVSQSGKDPAREHAAQALRSHSGPWPGA